MVYQERRGKIAQIESLLAGMGGDDRDAKSDQVSGEPDGLSTTTIPGRNGNDWGDEALDVPHDEVQDGHASSFGRGEDGSSLHLLQPQSGNVGDEYRSGVSESRRGSQPRVAIAEPPSTFAAGTEE